jgi:hypothetical protein
MNNPWEICPINAKGDEDPKNIHLAVGAALNEWEYLEAQSAELFDALVSAPPSNRAAFFAFISVVSSSARTQLLEAAAPRALRDAPILRDYTIDHLARLGKYGARRNELAHGRVYDTDEGFYHGPNNTMSHKWANDGSAKYQYTSEDIEFYRQNFRILRLEAEHLTEEIIKLRTQQRQHEERVWQGRGKNSEEA